MAKDTDYRERLERSGLKKTKHRIAILDILGHSNQPMTVEQVFSELGNKDILINLSTVYRILNSFVSKDLVTKLNLSGDNRALFEYNHMVHRHYLVCLGCKKILAIEHCPLKTYEESLEKEMNYTITGHKLDIYGYCPECRKKARQKDGCNDDKVQQKTNIIGNEVQKIE